jgi:GTP-binding protein LepA
MKNIRNFAIIAHVDHGKSTLADRFLEITGVLEKGKHEEQFLDRNPISRERGITIKLAPVRMKYQVLSSKYQVESIKDFENNESKTKILNTNYFILNLIDTPGHIDFSYEVDRTLACVEGVILLVDATQGIQAQTVANAYKALDKNLVIIPAINKIDLPQAQIEKTKKELIDFLGVKDEEIFLVSAKTGQGVEELLYVVIEKIPSPSEVLSSNELRNENNLSALVFDSYFDQHRGVIVFVRVFFGKIKKGQKVFLVNAKKEITVEEVGYFTPDLKESGQLSAGEIGYVVTNLKDIHQVDVGETIIDFVGNGGSNPQPLPGYKKIKPMVFAGIFPTDSADYLNLKKALEKLYLNDAAISFSPVYSKALGSGFRVGFLGLLHAEVVCERLEREFGLSLVLTPPHVEFKKEKNSYLEPYVKLTIITPSKYLGEILTLCKNHRANFLTMNNIGKSDSIQLIYEMPMIEMISDFFDKLKSVSSGYASLDWEFLDYRPVLASPLTLLLNGKEIEDFSEVVPAQKAYEKASFLVSRLKELIPRQQFEVRIQAKFDGKIIASAKIPPFRKDVLVKSGKVLGTGDVSRKRKLLERQKEGKKRMKMVGDVEIPKEAFLKLFRK